MEKKDAVIPPIRITKEEKELIELMAQKLGLSVSKFILWSAIYPEKIQALITANNISGK